jgi:hypothetical protein
VQQEEMARVHGPHIGITKYYSTFFWQRKCSSGYRIFKIFSNPVDGDEFLKEECINTEFVS